MNHPDPFKVAAAADSHELSAAVPRPDPRVEGPAGPDSFARADSCFTGAGLAPELAELAEEITRRLQDGEVVDLDDYAARHPEWADSLRQLMPVLREMADMGRAVVGGSGSGEVAGGRSKGSGSSATSGCFGRSAAGAWGSSTRPSNSRWAAGSL
ncbi:hypothetical protein [Singulisphaera sp. GP187]|uniref:hypothetical protein n=1 Tax=Singulisphaera sp. GP187 TaxID=1882752 RepID=UPI0020B1486B|nr:hypothetical protein [Singulisphaera sp. GP187]